MSDSLPTPVTAIIHLDHGRIIIQKLHESQLHRFEIWQETPMGMISVARAKCLVSAIDRTKKYLENITYTGKANDDE